jgi:competence protein ComEC
MRSCNFGNRHLITLCIVLTAMCLLAGRELLLLPDGKLYVHFLDVGQGDATLVVTPSGKQILIDGGPDTGTLEHLGRYMPFFDRTIDLLVLTHPNADHLTALPEILRRYSVASVLLSGSDYGLGRYEAVIDEILSQKISVVLADPMQQIDMGDGVLLDVLWPSKETLAELDVNNASVVLRVLYKEESILLPGDIEFMAEQAILQSGISLRSTVLKAAHHGSKTSSSTGFLLATNPELVIVSAGEENRFGHPNTEVVHRLENMGIPLRSTAKEGTISLTFP